MNWLNKPFSHIYIEHGAKDYPATIRIIESFPRAEIIFINNYKEVFNRRNQSFAAQKKSPITFTTGVTSYRREMK